MHRLSNFSRPTAALLGALLAPVAWAATVQVTVLSRDGQPLPDAVVVLEPSSGAGTAPLPVQATIVQEKMQFVPAVTVVPRGSTVRFTNLDRYEHHVRARAAGLAGLNASADAGIELRLGGKAEGRPAASEEVRIDKAGALQLGCHIHGSMRGSLYVTDSPWTALTGENGVATLQNVPEGAANLRVWHADQLLDGPVSRIQVNAVSALNVATQITPRRRRR